MNQDTEQAVSQAASASRLPGASAQEDSPDTKALTHRGGFEEKKKVLILLGLLLIGGGVAAYQFLWADGPKAADAGTEVVVAPGGLAPTADQADVDAVLGRLEAETQGPGQDELTVARVEALVKKFDVYVRDRQVPRRSLIVNPFERVTVKAPAETPAPALSLASAKAEAPRRSLQALAARLTLGSVIIAGDKRMAVINGKPCRIGDSLDRVADEFEGIRVTAIEPERVVLACDGENVDLGLRPKAGRSKKEE